MKILAIVNRKGGAGKTTVTLHLGVAAMKTGLKVGIVDMDPQKSALIWSRARGPETPPHVIASDTSELQDNLDTAESAGYDLIILDTPPHTQAASGAAIQAAAFCLVPVQASALDLGATTATRTTLRELAVPSAAVLTRTDHQGNEANDAEQALTEMGFEVCPVRIGNRVAYRRALNVGQAVFETEPRSKAAEEVTALWSWVKDRI